MQDNCPCHGCKDRVVTDSYNCHQDCYDRYIPWTERQEAKKKRIRKIKDAEAAATGHKIDTLKKVSRANKRSWKR